MKKNILSSKLNNSFSKSLLLSSSLIFVAACSNSSSDNDEAVGTSESFTLNFNAVGQGAEVSCDQMYTGFGPEGNDSIGIGDLRFYVSNLVFRDFDGNVIETELDDNDFQLNDASGSVALIDFMGQGGDPLISDFCNVVSEATARTNTQISGTVADNSIASVEFELGVPQALMQSIIQSGSAEDAPSPLNEMYWSWASGYRHLVANFTMMNSTYTSYVNNSAFHIGSRDCGGASGKALTDIDECGLLNTAKVLIADFDPDTDSISFDIEKAFAGLLEADIISSEWRKIGTEADEVDESLCIDDPVDHGHHGRWCVIGETYGAQCHSGSTQSACESLFPNFGLDLSTGLSDEATNQVFSKAL